MLDVSDEDMQAQMILLTAVSSAQFFGFQFSLLSSDKYAVSRGEAEFCQARQLLFLDGNHRIS